MMFKDLTVKLRADALKAKMLGAYHQSDLTLQELESITSIDYNHHQRSLDLKTDQYPSIILPALLCRGGDSASLLAATLLEIASEPVRAAQMNAKNGSISDQILIIGMHLGRACELVRDVDLAQRGGELRMELMELIRHAETAMNDLDALEGGTVNRFLRRSKP